MKIFRGAHRDIQTDRIGFHSGKLNGNQAGARLLDDI
jgi:hypothetical protein